MQVGGEGLTEQRSEVFARRARRRVPIAVAVTAVVLLASVLLPGTEPNGRDAIAVAAWTIVIGVTIGLLASLATPEGRWWRWTAPTLATAASVPLLGAAGVVLWFAGGGEIGFFGEPNRPADAWWYPPVSVGLVVAWIGAVLLGFQWAGQRRRYALAPLALAAGSLAVLAALVNLT